MNYYSINDLSKILNLSNPTLYKMIYEVKDKVAPNIWELHTLQIQRSNNNHEKKPTLYVDQYIFDLLSLQLRAQKYYITAYKALPNKIHFLKKQLIEYILKDDPLYQSLNLSDHQTNAYLSDTTTIAKLTKFHNNLQTTIKYPNLDT